jgi:3-hydroxyisobutyrate dehydrogenase
MDPVKDRLGFIGTGVMGKSMAGHLMRAGYRVHIHTRTQARASDLLNGGAIWEESPASLAGKCSCIFTMVGYPSDVEAIYFGPSGLIENCGPGTLLIDMTTSSPDLALRIYKSAKAKGLGALDAPVSGGDIGAKNATLTIMIGGDQSDSEKARSLFELLGETIVLQGPAGSGQHTKMANQIVIAGNLAGAVEAIIYAQKAGLDPRTVLKNIGAGSAASWQLGNMVPRILDGNFEPGFYVKHFLKDLRIALEAARDLQITLPLLTLAERLFATLEQEGFGDKGTQALWLLYDRGILQGAGF